MSKSRYKYLCVREDDSIEKIASQDIYDILNEYGDFVSIIRQDLYYEDIDSDYYKTTWHD